MAAEVLCGRCGTLLTNPNAPCPRCGSPASGGYAAPAPGAYASRASGAYAAPVARAPKSPILAAALAIVPGLGHVYLGHNLKGLVYFVGVGGLQFFGLDLDLTVIGATIGVPIEFGGAGLWVYSIVDAYRTAKQTERPSY